MRSVTRLAGLLAGLMLTVVVWTPPAHADEGLGLDVRAASRTGDPVRFVVTVMNNSQSACGLARTAEGTVQVVSVRRDGQELSPVLGRSFYLDGLTKAIAAGLVAAEPGSTVDVPVAGYRTGDGDVVLRSVAATPDGGGLDTMWPIGAPGRYEVTASYAIPAAVAEFAGDTTPCAGTTATRTVAFTTGVGAQRRGFPWLWVAAGALVLFLLGVLLERVCDPADDSRYAEQLQRGAGGQPERPAQRHHAEVHCGMLVHEFAHCLHQRQRHLDARGLGPFLTEPFE